MKYEALCLGGKGRTIKIIDVSAFNIEENNQHGGRNHGNETYYKYRTRFKKDPSNFALT